MKRKQNSINIVLVNVPSEEGKDSRVLGLDQMYTPREGDEMNPDGAAYIRSMDLAPINTKTAFLYGEVFDGRIIRLFNLGRRSESGMLYALTDQHGKRGRYGTVFARRFFENNTKTLAPFIKQNQERTKAYQADIALP